MSEEFLCPRRSEIGSKPADKDHWRTNPSDPPGVTGAGQRACSYCGSAHPDDFFAAIERGDEIGPTDKSYKAYINGATSHHKFYFLHLDDAQRQKFVELLNEHKIKIGFPGHFYALPFFCTPHEVGKRA